MATAPAQPSVESMTNAAQAFVDSLTAAQRERTTYEYMDAERIFWYYPPINRHGLPLRDMTAGQRELAYALMRTRLDGAFLRAGSGDHRPRADPR